MAKFSSFEEIISWQKSRELNKDIYNITNKNSSFSKDFGLRDQIRRCSISISSNIAEGCSRNSDIEFKRFLEIAMGSLFEVETQFIIANELQFLTNEDLLEVNLLIEKEGKDD